MLDQYKTGNILFLDIETVPAWPSYDEVPIRWRMLWDKKASYLKKTPDESVEDGYKKAGIFAEFGRIVCICTGMIGTLDERRVIRLKSFYSRDEKQLLMEFGDLLTRICQKREIDLCAHNGKEFDFPYIARRMLVNGLKIPPILDTSGKRPWEVKHIDTLELWKFGDHKHYTSLDLLASLFNLDSPKADIDGSQVADVYWNDHDLERIAEYCRKDVITIARLMLRFKGEPVIGDGDIIIMDSPSTTMLSNES